MKGGAGLKVFTRKRGGGGVRQNGGRSRNGALPYYIGILLEIQYDAANEKKTICFFLFQIKYEMIGIVIWF